jgi:hypothetical protein
MARLAHILCRGRSAGTRIRTPSAAPAKAWHASSAVIWLALRRSEPSPPSPTSESELGKVSGKSKTAEAIRYALTRREALERFLIDGRIDIDSNIVERAIRPQTITRKNSLFAGSHGGGRTWATVATLLKPAK